MEGSKAHEQINQDDERQKKRAQKLRAVELH
jgi:hypothetical protein